ncbi:MAG: outer membrane lipoprotein carrier protein LolA [Prevotellaceae bacterium]|jgi:outer membrane lipoprotein-sorting protein|nr:outer membrane lipoprotein carrier protein LolA [Prevotellaceae bacterium]
MMKFVISFYCLLLLAFAAAAQTAFVPVVSAAQFEAALAKASGEVNDMECDFTQTKHMEMLSEKIISRGKFYYKKTDKTILDYHVPVQYLIVINGQKIKIVSGGKTNVYELQSNKMMSQSGSLLSACMTGNLHLLSPDYRLEYGENDAQYRITVTPLGEVNAYLKEIDIYLNKKDFSVDRLKMTEPSRDYTEYVFTNKRKNISLPDEKFNVN